MNQIDDKDLEDFKTEAFELLDLAEKSLLGLDSGESFTTCFDAIFRSLHNIKGGAGMMELEEIQKHTHELETIFMSFKGKEGIPQAYINLFLRGIDAIRMMLNGSQVNFCYEVKQVVEQVQESNDSSLEEFLSECDEIINRISLYLQALESGRADQKLIDSLYREVHSLKGAAYLFSCNFLGDVAHAMENSLEKIRNGTHNSSLKLMNCLFKSLEVIEALLKTKKMNANDSAFSSVVPLVAKALNKASEELEEIASVKAEPQVEEQLINKILPVAENKQPSKELDTEHSSSSSSSSSIRVSVALLDNLMTLMGEMVLVRNQVLQYSNNTEDLEFHSMSKRLNVVTSEIQGEMMKTRMQPIGTVVEKFHRLVRDISSELGKKISLSIVGSETELDKSLLEAIKDPLTHIVRNACDHGIERPGQRSEVGKSETGLITIRAYHEGGQVVIEVTDDGKGLDKAAIIKKAIEKGMLTLADSYGLNDKEAYELIFSPGFSTAEKVTNVSGRGVGMDVVRTNIDRIGGAVELSPGLEYGTKIKIKIPLTLAIVPALIVKCSGEIFAIPQVNLEELVRVDPQSSLNKIEFIHGSPVYRLRENILPLIDLNALLGIGEKNQDQYRKRITNIAVLNAENRSFGVIIDEIQDTADIVVKPINRILKTLQVYSGATVLGDGSVALIFDVLGISKLGHISQVKTDRRDKENVKVDVDFQDFLLIGLNSPTTHALALNYVQRLEEFRVKDVEYSAKIPVVRYRDNILPLISVNYEIGYDEKQDGLAKIPVIVIEKQGKLYGLVVDEIVDTLSTQIDLVEPIKTQKGIFGNLNLDDKLIVVVDPYTVIENAFPSEKTTKINSPLGHSLDSLKILLVEDTVYFKKAVGGILKGHGFEVIHANNGIEALNLLSTHHDINLVVSDIEMPQMNGIEFVKKSKSSYPSLPVIALSSKADKKSIEAGISAGFDLYLEKLDSSKLISAISQMMKSLAEAA